MAFENVDVSSLRNALTQCKNSINHSTTNELMNNISNTSVWQASDQANLKKALTKLENERYKNLEDKINSLLNPQKIEEKSIPEKQTTQIEKRKELNMGAY